MLTAKVFRDNDAESPRSWHNLGTMVCWHRRYRLGDEQPKESPADWMVAHRVELKGAVVLPLFLFDHSGITMRCESFNDRWDSGQVGWIYMTADVIRRTYGCKRISKKVRETATECLRYEVKTYDYFLTGDVWSYTIEDGREIVDSCSGFYGDVAAEEILASADPKYAPLIAAAWESRFS